MTTLPLAGKLCLVTGASSGIGKVTAREFARLGARDVLVCRSRERGERALLELNLALGSARLHLLVADLSSQRDVRRLAAEVRKNFDALHVWSTTPGCTAGRGSSPPMGSSAPWRSTIWRPSCSRACWPICG